LLAVVVVIFGLLTAVLCVPPSLPIPDTTSSGDPAFDPFTTKIDITSGCNADNVIVTVCPGPTTGIRAYHTPVRRSNPVVVLVGPATAIHPFPKLSVGVIVTPACEDAHSTSKSPPLLLNAALVCVVIDVELI
jgi:hypothetical protein